MLVYFALFSVLCVYLELAELWVCLIERYTSSSQKTDIYIEDSAGDTANVSEKRLK